jgi:hypothetical protein
MGPEEVEQWKIPSVTTPVINGVLTLESPGLGAVFDLDSKLGPARFHSDKQETNVLRPNSLVRESFQVFGTPFWLSSRYVLSAIRHDSDRA